MCVCVCMTVWNHVEASIKGLDRRCHCSLESSLKAHYTAGLCELLAFIVSRKSPVTVEKAAPTFETHFKAGTQHAAGNTGAH